MRPPLFITGALLCFFFTSINSYSQEVTIWEMQHTNGGNIANNESIKIKPGNSTDVQFIMEISNLKNKTGDLRVFTKKSTNDSPVLQGDIINISQKKESFLAVSSAKLNSRDFNSAEGMIYIEFKDKSGKIYTSNNYPISVTPEYEETSNTIEEIKE